MNINSFKFLKSKVERENRQLFNKINKTEGINKEWVNIEKVKQQLDKQETETFLSIVKDWSEEIDKKSIKCKKQLIEPSFKQLIEENEFIVLSLNYTNLIEKIYGISETKVVKLHVGKNGLPYMDFNDKYVPNSDNIKKV